MKEDLVTGIAFVSVYATNFEESYRFYTEVIGLVKAFDMGEQACFFDLGDDQGLYLQGGNKPATCEMETTRCSFTLSVKSAGKMFELLKENGVKTEHSEPQEMGPDIYWFVFFDPSGNTVEILGPK